MLKQQLESVHGHLLLQPSAGSDIEKREASFNSLSKQLVFPVSNLLTKWMKSFGNTGFKFHCPAEAILMSKLAVE